MYFLNTSPDLRNTLDGRVLPERIGKLFHSLPHVNLVDHDTKVDEDIPLEFVQFPGTCSRGLVPRVDPMRSLQLVKLWSYHRGFSPTKHLQLLQRCHAQNEILLGEVQNLNLLRNITNDRFRFCSFLAYARHLSQEVLVARIQTRSPIPQRQKLRNVRISSPE